MENTLLQFKSHTTTTVLGAQHDSAVVLELEDGAIVHYIDIVTGDRQVKKVAHLGRDAQMFWHSIILGGINDQEVITYHNGAGANSYHWGIFLGREHDRFTMNYWSDHAAQHTTGHILVHGVLLDSAYADFKGNIKIHQTAADTEGSLTEHTLLLGDRSRSDSIPELDIGTNTVKVAHSSAITKIDDEQLFYLASRGIEPAEAKRFIVRGFLDDVLEHIPAEAGVLEQVEQLIAERLESL